MPIHCKAVVALTIVLAASAPASAQTMPSESPRAIESFVAPPALFPPESSYDGKVPPDLPAFDRANGRRVGSIALARPECIAMAQDRQEAVGCTYPLGFVYKTTDALQAYPVPVKGRAPFRRAGLSGAKHCHAMHAARRALPPRSACASPRNCPCGNPDGDLLQLALHSGGPCHQKEQTLLQA